MAEIAMQRKPIDRPMRRRATLLLAAALLLPGCSAMPVAPLPRTPPDGAGEVLVFREPAFLAGGLTLAVGAGATAFANIGNGEQVVAELPVGDHEIFVRTWTAEPTKLRIKIQPGARVCLRTTANPDKAARAVVPVVLMTTDYSFYLDPVPCPAAGELARYKLVPVTYR